MYCVSDGLSLHHPEFHRLGWYVIKANPWCHDFATLTLYHLLHVIKPIRLCFNDVPQRRWFVEVIIRLPYQLICVWLKPITYAYPL